MIEINNFTKCYGPFVAVADLNLKISAGEMFGFIGPNGAGKSTTIRFLATLLKATEGDGTINGHSVTRDPLGVRQSVGYMPDNFGVYDGMKVWEFLDFFSVAYQVPKVRRKQVLTDVLELLDLTQKRDDFVNSLSRGMKQRICLAQALINDPDLIILDILMPGMDGPEVDRKLKDNPKTKDLPVIFLTSLYTKEEEHTSQYTAGNNMMFAKPYEMDELLEGVEAAIYSSKGV